MDRGDNNISGNRVQYGQYGVMITGYIIRGV